MTFIRKNYGVQVPNPHLITSQVLREIVAKGSIVVVKGTPLYAEYSKENQ